MADPTKQFPCKHLRCKEMFHEPSPLVEDDYSSGAYWCNRTHDAIGPDRAPVEPAECKRHRLCYEE